MSGLFSRVKKIRPGIFVLTVFMNRFCVFAFWQISDVWQRVLVLCLSLTVSLLAALSEYVRIELDLGDK
jgi:hypothetical protein